MKPFSIKITKGKTHYFAENESLDIYASGLTIGKAIREFADGIDYCSEHYEKIKNVSGEAARLKELYKELTE